MDNRVKIIRGGLLIDGRSPSPIENSVITVDGERITSVGVLGEVDTPSGEVIDAKGKVVMPGLIDSHVHITISKILPVGPRREALQHLSLTTIEAENRLQRLLEAGFTTILDCGALEHIDLALRYAIEKRMITGPRLLCCGKAITITGGHADSYFLPPLCTPTPYMWGRVCDGVDEVRKGVREEMRAGVDWLKLMHAGGGSLERAAGPPQLAVEEIRAACEEAHRVGLKVCVHAQGNRSIKDSVLGGVDSVDHGYEMDEEAAEMMRKNGVVHKMTSMAKGYLAEQKTSKDRADFPEVVLKKAGAFPYNLKKRALLLSLRNGVKVVAASDAEGDDNGVINSMEPAHWVYAGVAPMEALMAMTRRAAELLGVDAGSIETGKLADILIIDGNPLESIEVLQDKSRIKMVMKEGRIEVKR